ncbi:hypothetical protein [Wenjunlia tyrosinilytica]|uniref:DUF385 domain-containing protein n=1 Tax=Wenjunlia tyrosinilytica TaxID=1544741 RepID=A0A918E1S8_9ACTN|nr:hypothetical protein [Wenjunlia tyrosinilytica]GGO97295.1 hypothetical protein GCM10012280_58810 [Wenjunlia tyrosinilytica]
MTEQRASSARGRVRPRTPSPVVRGCVNPVMRRLLDGRWRIRPLDGLAVLHFSGRRTGRRFRVPVGLHALGGHELVVATSSGWRHNLHGGRTGVVSWRGRRRSADFWLLTDLDLVVAGYQELIGRYGVHTARRRLGLVIEGDTVPDRSAIREAVVRHQMSLVLLQLTAQPRRQPGQVARKAMP